MSANDDDELEGGDDPQLASLRAVWVSMRESDDDPPDRGLAALMAAAREKAADMAPTPPGESWWQRALALFRRPPVMALATVTVLLGGALFMAQRSALKSDTKEVDERAHVTQPSSGPRPTSSGSAMAAAPPPPEPPTITDQAPRPPPPPAPPAETRPEPVSPRPPVVKSLERPGRVTSGEGVKVETPVKQPDVKTTTATAKVGGQFQVATDEETVPTGTLASPPTTRAPVRKPPEPTSAPTSPVDPSIGGLAAPQDDVVKDSTKKAPESEGGADKLQRERSARVSQLVRQCESAAARSDCGAVRVLAKEVKSMDSEAYKQRIEKNTSIARCLE